MQNARVHGIRFAVLPEASPAEPGVPINSETRARSSANDALTATC